MTEITTETIPAADGTALAVTVYGSPGSGPVVMCLPGLTRNSRDFAHLAADLSDRWRIVTPDLRGRGWSGYDPTGASYVPGVYVSDMFGVLDSLGIDRATLIGTSLGGSVAMAMGADRPQRIAGIVLNDVGPQLDRRGFARIQSYAGKMPPVQTWDDAVAQARKVNEIALPGLSDADWMAFARRLYCEDADGGVRADHDPKVAAGMDAVDPDHLPDSWATFDALAGIPLLVIRGALSDLFSADTVSEMLRRRPDMDVLVVADRGHAPTLDEPECRAAIRRFLTRA